MIFHQPRVQRRLVLALCTRLRKRNSVEVMNKETYQRRGVAGVHNLKSNRLFLLRMVHSGKYALHGTLQALSPSSLQEKGGFSSHVNILAHVRHVLDFGAACKGRHGRHATSVALTESPCCWPLEQSASNSRFLVVVLQPFYQIERSLLTLVLCIWDIVIYIPSERTEVTRNRSRMP